MLSKTLLGAAALLGLSTVASAQLSFGGLPPSDYDALLTGPVPTVKMDPVDVARLEAEDAMAEKVGAFRFGDELAVHLTPGNSGEWTELENGDRVWRLRIESAGAYSLSLIFDEFLLPAGSELYAYDDERTVVYGQYNQANNKANRMFAIQPLPGDALTLEYFEPAHVTAPGAITVGTVVHDYKDVFAVVDALGKSTGSPKAAGACNNDVNCPVGAPWGDQVRSVVAIFIGGGVCSGSMINNTSGNNDQLFITANHCGSVTNAVFRFNYEKSGCGSGTAPTNQTVQGSTLLKASSSGDYRLARLTQAIPPSYNVYLEGWDKSNVTPTSTIAIHHPQVGPKKISFDYNPPSKSGGDWQINQWDDGVTEPGSSGSPLYSNEGLFIGALYGGQATCSFPYNDYYPRLGGHFNALAQWLDPLGTGQTTLVGQNLGGGTGPSCGVTKLGVGAGGANIADLDSSSTPQLGTTISLVATGFNGSSVGTLILSLSSGTTPLLGGIVYVDYLNPAATMPINLTLGVGAMNVSLPASPGLAYTSGYAQVGTLDASQPFGWAFSNGLQITFCP
ncbi:MAG: hypothetical protein P1V81_07010 [Planctomycetota bacterium]|nr:hypothetical protein [Planctomycetota bacterium]